MSLELNDYTYPLPAERIAAYPLPERDQSKLLVYRRGNIAHHQFTEIADQLPADALLIFNNTRVIAARLLFQKESGATIEIFLLEPVEPSPVVALTMQAAGQATWRCAIGNLKKWKDGVLTRRAGHHTLTANLIDREQALVSLTWSPAVPLATLLEHLGEVPLPPYLKRNAEPTDRERYQTVYSREDGAVAAPTAGLHFTPAVLDALRTRGIASHYLTLHVSAGTFLPIKSQSVEDHVMHAEQVTVSRDTLLALRGSSNVIAVGTTSMRTLESLYWFGVKLQEDTQAEFIIDQRYAYVYNKPLPTREAAIDAILHYMDQRRLTSLSGETSIYILPGYRFRICRGLITNFHQPGSTLIVLVAAFIGADWRAVYDEALRNGYRFLSYGDSSLLIP